MLSTRSPSDSPAAAETKNVGKRRLLLRTLKVTLVVLVVSSLGWQIWMLAEEWSGQGKTLDALSIDGTWIAVATVAFLCSQVSFSLFWGKLLQRSGVTASRMEVLRAYGAGTLGKYVPGKALVVVARTGLLSAGRVGRLTVGLTVVYETLTMMAVGGVVASVCLLIVQPDQWAFGVAASVVATGLAVGLHPAVFGRLAKAAALPFKETRNDFSAKACSATVWRWGAFSVGGWLLMGASFWAVAQAVGMDCASVDDLVFLTGASAIATAGGFLVLFMPAGIGVRELVIIQLLAPRYGLPEVVLATLLLRTVWTLSEVFLGGALYGAAPLLTKLTGLVMPGRASVSTLMQGRAPHSTVSKVQSASAIGDDLARGGMETKSHTVADGDGDPTEDTAKC